MEKIDSRRLPVSALNERRGLAVKMFEAGITVREAITYDILRTFESSFKLGGWYKQEERDL